MFNLLVVVSSLIGSAYSQTTNDSTFVFAERITGEKVVSKNHAQKLTRFRKFMDELGQGRVSDHKLSVSAGKDLPALKRVASYGKQNSKLVREIEERYFVAHMAGRTSSRSRSLPVVLEAHRGPRYLDVWHYFLLAPQGDRWPSGWWVEAFSVIRENHRPDSLGVLRIVNSGHAESFKKPSYTQVGFDAQLLRTLGAFPCEEALSIMDSLLGRCELDGSTFGEESRQLLCNTFSQGLTASERAAWSGIHARHTRIGQHVKALEFLRAVLLPG